MNKTALVQIRYPIIQDFLKRKIERSSQAPITSIEDADFKKLLKLLYEQNDDTPEPNSNDLNPLEKTLAHLFLKFRNLQDTVESEYRKITNAIEEKTGVKFQIDTSPLSPGAKKLKVFDWLDGIIRNQRKSAKECNQLEETFSFLRDSLSMNLPFHKGITNELRAGFALNSLISSSPTLETIAARPYLDSVSKQVNYVENFPAFIQKFLFAHQKGNLPIKNPSDQIATLSESIEDRDKSEKPISLDRLGIDYLIKVKSDGGSFKYLPIQVKTQERDANNFQNKEVEIHLNHRRLEELKTKVDDSVIRNALSDKIVFKRKILSIGIEDKRLKTLSIELGNLTQNPKTLDLDQALSADFKDGFISNTDFIAAMINQGFLIPIKERGIKVVDGRQSQILH